MAKKRKKSTLGLVFSAGAVLFAIAAVCMMFLNAVELVSGENVLAQYTGVQVAFGYSETYPIIGEVKFLNFSIMNLLPYILALAGAVVAILAALSKKSFLLNIIVRFRGGFRRFRHLERSGEKHRRRTERRRQSENRDRFDSRRRVLDCCGGLLGTENFRKISFS